MDTAAHPGLAEAKSRRAWWVAVALPALLVLAACGLLRPELRTLAAPVLGPFAGHLYGHHECTMAAVWPVRSLACLALGVITLAVCAGARTGVSRGAALALLATWSFLWSGLALLSVLNTLS